MIITRRPPRGPRPRARLRTGFTVAEVMVGLLLSVAVVTLVWQIFWADQKRFQVDQNRLTALQGALLFDEYLTADLERIAIHRANRLHPEFNDKDPVLIEARPPALTLRVFGPGAGRDGLVPGTTITYRIEADTGLLLRQEEGRIRRFRNLVIEDLKFSILEPRLDFSRPPLSGLAATYGRDAPLRLLQYRITCISRTLEATPTGRQRDSERVTLVGAVPFLPSARRTQHPYWGFTTRELLEELPGGP